jgi:DNA replication protein DnaC
MDNDDDIMDSTIDIYTTDNITVKKYEEELKKYYNKYQKIDKAIFIKYYYISDNGEETYVFKDMMKDVVYPESYPFIENLDTYIEAFLKSDEPLLFLYGQAGTGKSRLIRYIMKKIMDKYGGISSEENSVEVLYTSDEEVLTRTNIFIDYINSNNKSLLVLEDMDCTFISRNKDNNNLIMNKFLSTSDGIIQTIPQKKMIFSSNIKSLSDIDEALIRQGRCFDVIEFRTLTKNEATVLLKKMIPDITDKVLNDHFGNENNFTIAHIYQIMKKIKYPSINVPRYKKTTLNKVGF